MQYAFRAELDTDVHLCRAALIFWLYRWQVQQEFLLREDNDKAYPTPEGVEVRSFIPDQYVEFTLLKQPNMPSLNDIRWIFDKLVDCHVAAQTVEELSDYTGNRDGKQFTDFEKPSREVIIMAAMGLRNHVDVMPMIQQRMTSAVNALMAEVGEKLHHRF